MKTQLYSIFFRTMTFAGLVLFAISCGSNTQAPATEEAPIPEVITDTKAPSTSKGVGNYTEVKLGPIDAAKAELGKAVFATKCTTCHKLTDEKFVGPGLQEITNRRTPEWILNMITNPELMIKSDPLAKKLFEEILSPMANQNISDEEARNILEYLRQNDSK